MSCPRSDGTEYVQLVAQLAAQPDGSVVTESVTAPDKHGRRYRTTAIHLAEPDYELLARALVRLAKQQLKDERRRGQH